MAELSAPELVDGSSESVLSSVERTFITRSFHWTVAGRIKVVLTVAGRKGALFSRFRASEARSGRGARKLRD